MVWNRVWFSRELRKCMNVFSFRSQMGKKEKEICEFVEDFKKKFSRHCSNLSNDYIIS